MAFQLSVNARNATLSAIETEIGINPILTISTGSVPGTAGTANTGVVVATMVISECIIMLVLNVICKVLLQLLAPEATCS